ncbi:MAG: T6SS baseplate protein J-like component [Nitrospira sp.]|jgi:hypothetical protein|nr:T6SS baseplate protein J-like component [Nitrospira sp.]
MREPAYIARKGKQGDQDMFDALRREGLGFVQDLSGASWTDYNLHDPGVTILEQVCYALTDLIYRTGFHVEDYLTGEDGHIDFERLALHPPEQIFPSRPTTHNDYRKLILDSIHDAGNAWVHQVAEHACRGLYHIVLRLNKDCQGESRLGKLEEARRIYARARNLCEDLETVIPAREIECEVFAEIEVTGAKPPADLLAEIYYECAKCLAADAVVHSFEESLTQGVPLEELLRGPATVHGLIQDQERNSVRQRYDLTTMFSAIKSVEGVEQIRQLSITRKDPEAAKELPEDPQSEIGVSLYLPHDREPGTITLFKGGKECPVRMSDVLTRYHKLNFRNLALRRSTRNVSSLVPSPRGRYRNLRAYFPIQNQFPAIYGINRYGVPATASEETQARARQLRAYLLLFDQVMANFSAGLHDLQTLFSFADQSRQSYGFQTLTSHDIPGIDDLYAQPAQDVLAKIVRKYDNCTDRKNRLLDYLLAVYGETFPQEALRRFSYYEHPHRVEDALLDSKVTFLSRIVEVTKNRAGAFNYLEPSWNTDNVSGLMERVSLLLGFKHWRSRSLTGALLKEGMKLIPHKIYSQVKSGTLELKLLDLEGVSKQTGGKFQTIPITETSPMGRPQRIHPAIQPIIPLQHNLISDALLREGITMERYRLGSLTAQDSYQLVFQPEREEYWWYLGAYSDLQSGVQSANLLRDFLIRLNIESEGIHLVEHILLRPVGKLQHEGLSLPEGQDFYSFRLTVIFPSWTARCHDHNFRLLAEETVRQNCPAHIYPEVHWLDFEKMCEFEHRYKTWLAARTVTGVPHTKMNVAARALLEFLLEIKRPVVPSREAET